MKKQLIVIQLIAALFSDSYFQFFICGRFFMGFEKKGNTCGIYALLLLRQHYQRLVDSIVF